MSALDVKEIQNLLAEYCLAADECRFEDWARLFTPDGEMQGPSDRARGFDDLVRFISSATEGLHLCSVPRLHLDGDHATSSVRFAFVPHDKTVRIGVYEDDLVRTNVGWRIRKE